MKINNKRSKTNHFNQKGITLIALVITIVVLLILAGVSINAIFSENGIINKAKDVQTKTDQATESDLDAINGLNEWINDKTGQTTPNEPISRNGKIPNGATYTKSDGTVLEGNGTNEFPDTPANEDIYEEGDYKYTCKINGWSVIAKDKTKTTYGKILSKIAEMPIVDMRNTFDSCDSLTTAPVIPSSVTSMDSTFLSCKRLTGTIEVNANPTSYTDCFKETQISEITGSTTLKNELLATR